MRDKERILKEAEIGSVEFYDGFEEGLTSLVGCGFCGALLDERKAIEDVSTKKYFCSPDHKNKYRQKNCRTGYDVEL